ncbi:unnamed protein product [Arabidopsis thaliana]|uniref:Uncharacterized protein n=1 Tax=Arabidopsis thaliana TaxID=3702 RepID=A0A5S9Y9Q4_ARATH|nr:unnamed protein product [Arabidopsis thaliana]
MDPAQRIFRSRWMLLCHIAASKATKEMIELNVEKFIDVGTVDYRSETPYSIPKSKLTLEYLRDHTYFRARTSMIAAVTRIRHKMCLAAKNRGRTA